MAKSITTKGTIRRKMGSMKRINPTMRRQLRPKFDAYLARKSEEFLERLEETKVMKELDGGPQAENITDIAPVGNLFSFLGFHSIDRPTDDLISYIRRSTFIKSIIRASTDGRSLFFTAKASVPSIAEIEDTATPMTWGNKSWIRGIEKGGFTGLNAYIYREFFNKSKSGTGLQRKKQNGALLNVRDGPSKTSPVLFIRPLLKDFITRLRKK